MNVDTAAARMDPKASSAALTQGSPALTRSTAGFLAFFALVVAVGLVSGSYPRYVVTLWLIYSISAIGLNIVLGYGKLYSLGHGGFMLLGAYGMGVLMNRWQLPIPLAAAAAAVMATLVGIGIGLPAIRLKHFSLAIVTFAFGITLFHLVKSMPLTGGPQGLYLDVAGIQARWQGRVLFLAAAALCLAAIGMSYSLMISRTGRALRIIAANEPVAKSFGINITFHKLIAFACAAFLGAIAGSMQALMTGVITPETYGPDLSILIFAAVMIGGQGRLLGPLLGAAFVVAIPEITQDARALAQIIYGLLFITIVTLFPEGLIGMLEIGWRRLQRHHAPPLPASSTALDPRR